MDKRKVLIVLILLGIVYFLLFILPNLAGTQDVNMLSIFEKDEFAQYPNVIRMVTPGDTFYQSIRNFSVYLHYFYGYPFYFFSAITLLPAKLVLGTSWNNQTPLLVMILRQMINVFPMILSVLIWVYMRTRFRSFKRALALFLLLLFVPAVVVNDIWWHPDSLGFLFVTLTFFFLDRDEHYFGRNYLLAAVTCGIALGIKYLGMFFILVIPVYILWGVLQKKISWKRAGAMGLAFVSVMLGSVVISNPLLLLPIERGELLATQARQFLETSKGFWFQNVLPYFQPGVYPDDFRIHYGELAFILLALAAWLVGVIRSKSRMQNVLIMAYLLPLVITLNNAATHRTHYFIPVMLPLFACLVDLFPENQNIFEKFKFGFTNKMGYWASRLIMLLLVCGITLQFIGFLQEDFRIVVSALTREKTSPGIGFYQNIEQVFLSRLPAGRSLVIYRDWDIYVPSRPNWRVELNWNLADYGYIQDLKPDIILLAQNILALVNQPGAVNQAVNPGNMRAWQIFYQDAAMNRLPGYQLIYQDNFGYALVKDGLFK